MYRNRTLILGCLLLSAIVITACGDEDEPTGPIVDLPLVTTGTLAGAGAGVVSVDGSVDPLGVECSYWFEYGLDLSYGNVTSETILSPTPAGPQGVTGQLTSLSSETTYHFRLLARNVAGTNVGDDAEFVTLPANLPPDTQVIAAPPDTVAAEVRWSTFWSGTDADGIVVAYEHRLISHGPNGVLDPADSLGVAWSMTTVTDTTLSWADGLGAHTFFVRAIDNLDARDPSPAQVSVAP